jgi:hypothetical protein
LGIIRMLRTNGDFSDLWEIVEAASPAKHDNFASAVAGFESWIKGKGIVWGSRPEPFIWQHGELSVLCNPEILMNIDGDPYRIKLYFKAPPVSQRRANLVIHLHEAAGFDDERIAILDVRRGKLRLKTHVAGAYDDVLRPEALSFAAMWRTFEQLGELPGDVSS